MSPAEAEACLCYCEPGMPAHLPSGWHGIPFIYPLIAGDVTHKKTYVKYVKFWTFKEFKATSGNYTTCRLFHVKQLLSPEV